MLMMKDCDNRFAQNAFYHHSVLFYLDMSVTIVYTEFGLFHTFGSFDPRFPPTTFYLYKGTELPYWFPNIAEKSRENAIALISRCREEGRTEEWIVGNAIYQLEGTADLLRNAPQPVVFSLKAFERIFGKEKYMHFYENWALYVDVLLVLGEIENDEENGVRKI